MEPLNQEQLNRLKEKAFPIFEHAPLQRKAAWEMLEKLEALPPELAPSDPAVAKEYEKLKVQLKWVISPTFKNDQEFFDLIQYHLLEGLELDLNLAELAADKVALQFGVNLRETLSGAVSALRANEQEIGQNPITIAGERISVRPAVKNWLIDFIRSCPNEYPTEMDETNYLFSSPNAKNLSEKDKTLLKKVLDFYDNFKAAADQVAIEEREAELAVMPPSPEAGSGQAPPPPSTGSPQASQTETAPPRSTTAQPTQPAEPITPEEPPAPSASSGQAPPQQTSPYQEPISQQDLAGPAGAQKLAAKAEPQIRGNIVDLSQK